MADEKSTFAVDMPRGIKQDALGFVLIMYFCSDCW